MSELKNKIDEIKEDIADVFKLDYTFTDTKNVPSLDDSDLTYESGKAKQGKEIETCVLFVDIRNSVKLNDSHHTETMGRFYTAFTKAVLKLARYHKGFVRNIIGDRVMVVFPHDNCVVNSVNCAISINHISQEIARISKDINFKCGIGIDYGMMNVIKVGFQVNGKENPENKGLVWVGHPANLASRLTDCANKEFKDICYCVTGETFINNNMFLNQVGISSLSSLPLPRTVCRIYTSEELVSKLIVYDGKLSLPGFFRIEKIDKQVKTKSYAPILISEEVYDVLKKACPNRNSIVKGLWDVQPKGIRDVNTKVYGADLHWILDDK